MKIQLKSIKTNLRFSEETTMFKADLFINDKKVAYCENRGCGGNTDYNYYNSEDKKIIEEAEKYCKSLPMVKFQDAEWEQSLEGFIDELVEKHLLNKDMKKGIIIKKNDITQLVRWTGITITQLLTTSKGTDLVKNEIIKLKSKGYEILNTNIPL